MDAMLAFINAAASGLIAIALIGAIVSTRVNDGVIVKVGLICMAMGFGSIAMRMFDGLTNSDAAGLAKSLVLVNTGVAVSILGYLWRKARAGHPVRRATDWSPLEDKESP